MNMKTKSFILLTVFFVSLFGGIFTPAFACSEGDYGPGCDDSTTTTDDSTSSTTEEERKEGVVPTTNYDGRIPPPKRIWKEKNLDWGEPPVPIPSPFLNQTLCLQKLANGQPIVFTAMPIFTNLITFNSTYNLCLNGWFFTNLSSSITIVNGQVQKSFNWFCLNSVSIDRDVARCTYIVANGTAVTTSGPVTTAWTVTTSNPITTSGLVTTGAFFIAGTVTGDNWDPLPNIPVILTYNGNTVPTSTDDAGNYIFSGLGVGGYTIRPDNFMPYLFPHSESVDINNSSANINFSWINATKISDNAIARLLNKNWSGETTSTSSQTSLNDWLNNLTRNREFWGITSGTGTTNINEDSLSKTNDYSFNNIFSGNSPFSLLEICGDGRRQNWETCDDGINNGKSGYCSSDCLYLDEVRFITQNGAISSSALSGINQNRSYATNIAQWLQSAGNEASSALSRTLDIMGTAVNRVSAQIDDTQEMIKKEIIENTSPRTRKIMKKAVVIAEVVAQYSVIGVVSLLGALAVSLHFMVFKSQWLSYTVQEWDTLDSLGNKFTMTERAMKTKNAHLKKWGLRPGMKIKVRNRHFIEKNYLDQLKSVLNDNLGKRHYGKMSAKIDKMFAKK